MKRSCLLFVILLLAGAGWLRADQTTSAVQEALKDQGFYYGDVTGEKNADTTAAIRRYQIRNGLQITGEIDAETLRSLGVGSNGPRSAPQPEPEPSPEEDPARDGDEGPAQSAEIYPPRSRAPYYASPRMPAPGYGPG
ncbi:MAG: peptidoglycan-binding protein, partial [Verrucomicrobiota bacterium]|nr:peptidoglycan-binding protein [Verrucomicrobiota bacterium]